MVDFGEENGRKFAVNFAERTKQKSKKKEAPAMGDAATTQPNGPAAPTSEPVLS